MLYPELLEEIMTCGETVKGTKELMHVQLRVPKHCLYDFPGVRPLDKIMDYAKNEIPWYMSGDRNSSFISEKASLWREIKNPDGTLNSNYGFLVFYNRTEHPSYRDQDSREKETIEMHTLPPFEWAARALEKDSTSRQGMVTYNTGGFNFVGNRDYICSQHQAFYIRDNRLLCYIALRSSDSIFGLPYNMVWWQTVYQQMLHRLRKTFPLLVEEDIIVTIYSSHIYERHYELVEKMLETKPFKYEYNLRTAIPLNNSLDWYLKNINRYISVK